MEKQRLQESEERKAEERRSEKRKAEERRLRRAKGRKVGKRPVFPMLCSSGGSKSCLCKVAGAEPPVAMTDEKFGASDLQVC